MSIQGLLTALITPFCGGRIDFDALGRICRRTTVCADGVVVLGTTAEPCALSMEERASVVRYVMTQTAKPVVVGLTGNDTGRVVACACRYRDMGASALLAVTPYYNRCNADGLVAHFRAIGEAVDIPIILYNVPARTGVNITPQTLSRLLLLPHVIGVKQASADAMQLLQYGMICRELHRTLFCGEDVALPLFRAAGAEGVISAAANAIPDVMAEGMHLPMRDLPHWVERYTPLLMRLFAEVNPIGIKQACHYLGLAQDELRLPLTPVPDPMLANLLQKAGFAVINQ